MELFSGYDNMMLGQADTEINEPITSQGCEMPSPYESQEVEEETFETLKAGGGIFDGMGAETAAPAPVAPPVAAPPVAAPAEQWIKGVPNVAVIAGVAALAAYFLLRKKG